jgi:hypothetical protein
MLSYRFRVGRSQKKWLHPAPSHSVGPIMGDIIFAPIKGARAGHRAWSSGLRPPRRGRIQAGARGHRGEGAHRPADTATRGDMRAAEGRAAIGERRAGHRRGAHMLSGRAAPATGHADCQREWRVATLGHGDHQRAAREPRWAHRPPERGA